MLEDTTMRLVTVGLLSTLALGLVGMPLLQILPGFGGMRRPVLVIDFASDDSMRHTLFLRVKANTAEALEVG